MRRARQTSESLELCFLLALSGGLMDAYSYLARGKVFANAQTGNMLLFGVACADGDPERMLRYSLPVLFFGVGIAVDQLTRHFCHERHVHWRQVCTAVEVLLLVVVALIPEDHNLVANGLTSLACGIQVQSFRAFHGRALATTMCIGNLRAGTQELVSYRLTRSRDQLEGMAIHYGVIITFVAGAIIGSRMIALVGLQAILASPVLLAIALALMFWDREGAGNSLTGVWAAGEAAAKRQRRD